MARLHRRYYPHSRNAAHSWCLSSSLSSSVGFSIQVKVSPLYHVALAAVVSANVCMPPYRTWCSHMAPPANATCNFNLRRKRLEGERVGGSIFPNQPSRFDKSCGDLQMRCSSGFCAQLAVPLMRLFGLKFGEIFGGGFVG